MGLGQSWGPVRGVYAPYSLRHFTPFSLLPSIFRRSLLVTNFHCSLFISLCSLLLFNVSSSSLIIYFAPFPNFLLLPAPFSKFLCSLLPDYVFLAPCSLPYFRTCSLLPWVSRAILPAPWLPLTGVHQLQNTGKVSLELEKERSTNATRSPLLTGLPLNPWGLTWLCIVLFCLKVG